MLVEILLKNVSGRTYLRYILVFTNQICSNFKIKENFPRIFIGSTCMEFKINFKLFQVLLNVSHQFPGGVYNRKISQKWLREL